MLGDLFSEILSSPCNIDHLVGFKLFQLLNIEEKSAEESDSKILDIG